MTNKLRDIYDKHYDETLNLIINKGTGLEDAKHLMGRIFLKAEETFSKKKKDSTKESAEDVFNKTRTHFGVC